MRSLFRSFSLGLICLLLLASSDAAINTYGYGSGRSPVAAQGGGVITVYPSANQSPDPGQGGYAVQGPSNTGHDSTSVYSNDSPGWSSTTQLKTARWSAFPNVAGQITSIRLKFDWWIGGSLDVSVLENGTADASYDFGIDVSLNGGSSWALDPVFSSNAIGIAGPGPVNDSAPIDGYGSVDINLTGTDISQIQVRDRLFVSTDSGIYGSDGSATASFGAAVSNIRLEVETVPCIASVPADRWKGEYFNNQTLTGSPAMARDDGTGFLNLNFGGASPSSACGLGADNFSARWTRTVNFAAGTYRFTATVDNGVRLYVDGQLKIDQWGNLPPNTYTADVALSAGNHEIKLEFVEYTGGASASLSWADLNCLANVPANRWKGEYFNNITLSGPPWMVRDDGTDFLNFNFGEGGPGGGCGLGVDNFSARWTRTVNFAASIYRFSVTVDDGVRLYVNGQLKIDKWFSQGATTYTADVALTAGAHEVKLEYFEGGGPGIALLSWVDATGVNCLPNMPLPLISSVPQSGGRENIASTAPSQAPRRCDPKIVTAPRAPTSD